MRVRELLLDHGVPGLTAVRRGHSARMAASSLVEWLFAALGRHAAAAHAAYLSRRGAEFPGSRLRYLLQARTVFTDDERKIRQRHTRPHSRDDVAQAGEEIRTTALKGCATGHWNRTESPTPQGLLPATVAQGFATCDGGTGL